MKVKHDPKYINIPNICFSLLSEDDKRESEYSKQRLERGFDDSETWSLDGTISSFILPRLKRFKEVKAGFPAKFKNEDEWDLILDKMIDAFQLMKDEFSYSGDEENNRIEEGLDFFREYFHTLWW